MTLDSVNIEHFCSIDNVSLHFSDKVNLSDENARDVIGFIRFMLYGEKSDASPVLLTDDRAPVIGGSMRVKINHRFYVISRHIRHTDSGTDNGIETVSAENVSEGQRENNAKEASAERLRAAVVTDEISGDIVYEGNEPGAFFLGIKSRTFDDVSVSQRFPSEASEPGMSIDTENMIFSADENMNSDGAMNMLSAMCRNASTDTDNGAMHERMLQAEDMKEKLASAYEANRKTLTAFSEIKKLNAEIPSVSEKLESQAQLEEYVRYAGVIESFDRLHEMEDLRKKQRQNVEEYRRENGHLGFCPDSEYRKRVALSYKQMRDTNKMYNESIEEYCRFNAGSAIDKSTEEILRRAESLGGSENVRAKYNEAYTGFRILLMCGIVCALLFMTSLIVGIATNVSQTSSVYYIGWGISLFTFLGSSALFSALSVRYYNASCRMAADFNVKQQSELQSVLKKIDEAKIVVKQREERLQSINRLCEKNKEDFDAALKEYRETIELWGKKLPIRSLDKFTYELDDEIRRYIEGENELRDALYSTENGIKQIRDKLCSYDEVAVRSDIAPSERAKFSAMDYESINDELIQIRDRYTFLTDSVATEEKRISDIRAEKCSGEEINNKVELFEEETRALQDKYALYCAALSAIGEAKAYMVNGISQKIADGARKWFSGVNGYSSPDAEVNDKDSSACDNEETESGETVFDDEANKEKSNDGTSDDIGEIPTTDSYANSGANSDEQNGNIGNAEKDDSGKEQDDDKLFSSQTENANDEKNEKMRTYTFEENMDFLGKLKRGTSYIAVKNSMSDVLCDERPFLIVNFPSDISAEYGEELSALCNAISHNRQVIIFMQRTCSAYDSAVFESARKVEREGFTVQRDAAV